MGGYYFDVQSAGVDMRYVRYEKPRMTASRCCGAKIAVLQPTIVETGFVSNPVIEPVPLRPRPYHGS